ncbi:hypothetical protein L1887_51873 [Cichorium endivia]|nr:hypothetical protein L1887_51873 [Cichorium endivia]
MIDAKTRDDELPPISTLPDLAAVELAVPSTSPCASLAALVPVAVDADHVPPFSQSAVVLLLNFLLNMTFFIIVPTSAAYANQLGASTWFSGLTIGISNPHCRSIPRAVFKAVQPRLPLSDPVQLGMHLGGRGGVRLGRCGRHGLAHVRRSCHSGRRLRVVDVR